jgi:SAM-dependent methyltransferase
MAATTLETEHFGTVAIRHRHCPLCGHDGSDVPPGAYSHRPWAVKECPHCRFVYIESAPLYEVQFETMAWERTTKVEEQRRAKIRPISYRASKLTRFRNWILPKRTMLGYIAARMSGGNVVDLGCGDGHVLAGFPPSFTPFGIEISAHAAAAADRMYRPRGGYAVHAASIEGLKHFGDGFFAAATLRSYLEHEAEPLAVLEGLQRVLIAGGIAVIKVPNYGSLNRMIMGRRWCGFRYPDHLNYFTPSTLRSMAAKAGFATRFGATGNLPTSDNMWAVLTKPA